MNKLSEALAATNDDLDNYLEVTSTDDIRNDITELLLSKDNQDIKDFKEKIINLIKSS